MALQPNQRNTAKVLTANELAVLRTTMAADRTLMAWVRTSLSLLSFGFTIYKVLQGLLAEGQDILVNDPRNAGLVLVFAGTLAIILGIGEYINTHKYLGSPKNMAVRRFTLLIAAIMCLAGIALFVAIAVHLV